MTIVEIKKELTKLGIEYPAKATHAELLALLSKDEKEASEEEGQPTPPAETVPEPESEDGIKGDAVRVEWRGTSRVFSKDIHGKDFKKIAEGFAKKFDGKIVKI